MNKWDYQTRHFILFRHADRDEAHYEHPYILPDDGLITMTHYCSNWIFRLDGHQQDGLERARLRIQNRAICSNQRMQLLRILHLCIWGFIDWDSRIPRAKKHQFDECCRSCHWRCFLSRSQEYGFYTCTILEAWKQQVTLSGSRSSDRRLHTLCL